MGALQPPTKKELLALKRFGYAVHARRTSLSLSQEELGFRAKLQQSYVSGIESGQRNPSLVIVLRLAKALETSVGELLEGAPN